MSAEAIAAFLARLYTVVALRQAFLAQLEPVARAAGLSGNALRGLLAIDRDGLLLAARSLGSKRAVRAGRPTPWGGPACRPSWCS